MNTPNGITERGRDMKDELLKTLYQTYSREIYLYLYSLCGQTAMSEDLMQETFLKALLSLRESHTNMRAWLYTVARNLYLNEAKRREKEISSEDFDLEADRISSDILSDLMDREETKWLLQAMLSLSPRKREILQMQYFGGLSQGEIARILSLTPANVRVLAMRAKKEIKQFWEEHGYDVS